MPRRKLTELDTDIIDKLYPSLLAEEIAEKLPPGIGVKTVQDYIDAHLYKKTVDKNRADKIAPSKSHEPKGFAISTEADSAMSDARITHHLKEATERQHERNKGYIHVPFDK